MDQITLTAWFEWQILTPPHAHEHPRKRADTHINTRGLRSVDCKQYTGKRHQGGVDGDTLNTDPVAIRASTNYFHYLSILFLNSLFNPIEISN